MQIAKQKIGDSSVLVKAEGSLVEHRDADEFVFHVMPKLYLPYSNVTKDDVKFLEVMVTYQDHTHKKIRRNEAIVSQPFPNSGYYVAGDPARKMGWVMKYNSENPPVEVYWQWYFIPAHQYLSNKIMLSFEENPSGHVFTTDQGTIYEDLCSYHRVDEDDFFNKSIRVKSSEYGHLFFQKAHLVSRPLSHCSFYHFKDQVYLRDVDRQTEFKTNTDLFKSLACIEMPATIPYHSCWCAMYEDDEDGTLTPDSVDDILFWWNHNAPNPDYRVAEAFEIYCRVEDNDELWAAYRETPNIAMHNLLDVKDAIARVSDNMLIIFMAQDKENPVYMNFVTGEPYFDFDEEANARYWWYGWESMKTFLHNFPELMRKLEYLMLQED